MCLWPQITREKLWARNQQESIESRHAQRAWRRRPRPRPNFSWTEKPNIKFSILSIDLWPNVFIFNKKRLRRRFWARNQQESVKKKKKTKKTNRGESQISGNPEKPTTNFLVLSIYLWPRPHNCGWFDPVLPESTPRFTDAGLRKRAVFATKAPQIPSEIYTTRGFETGWHVPVA